MKRVLTLFTVLILSLAGLIAFTRAQEPKPKPLRALMVCGGCCHDYEKQKLILSEGISKRASVEWTIVHESAPKGSD